MRARILPAAVLLLLIVAAPLQADEAEDALALYEQGKWTEAAAAYRALVDQDPAAYDAHVKYQRAHARSGADAGELTTYYDSLVAKAPDAVALKLHRLRLMPAEKRGSALKPLLSEYATDCSVHMESGRTALATGKASSAVTALKKAQALATGGRRDVVLLLAQAYVAKGRPADALKVLGNAVKADAQFHGAWAMTARVHLIAGDADKARGAAEAALLIRSRSVPTLLIHAEALAMGDDIEGALKSAGAAQRIAPHLPETSTALGDYVARDGKEASLERAVGLYKEALAADEEFAGALHGLGWALERQKKYEEAEKPYRTLSTVRPNDPQPLNSVGWCLYKLGRVSEAQLYFRRASDVDPKFAAALANLGMTYDAQAKFAKAIKVYEKVLRMKEERNNLRVIINCAFDHESLGAYSKAVKLLERAHKIRPGDAQIMTWLGDDWFFQKKWTKAESWYEKAVAVDDKLFAAWRGLGYCLVQRKKWKQAAVALEKAMKLDQEDTDVPLTLGDIYLNELDDLEKALKAYKTYTDRGGSDQDILDLITEIENQLK